MIRTYLAVILLPFISFGSGQDTMDKAEHLEELADVLDNLGFAHDLDDLITKFENDPDFANSDEFKDWFGEQMKLKHD